MSVWLALVVPVLVLLVVLLFAFTGCTRFGVAEEPPAQPSPPSAPITRVQAQTATGSGSATASWSPATTKGNLLVAVVATPDASDVISAPAGWVRTFVPDAVGQRPRVEIWHFANNPGGRSSEAFTCSPPSSAITLDVREYAGAAAADVLDKSASNGDANATMAISTGPAFPVAPTGLAVAGLANRRAGTGQGMPTNGHVQVSVLTSPPGPGPEHRLQGTEKIGNLGASEQTGTTLETARPWSAAIAVFKSASV